MSICELTPEELSLLLLAISINLSKGLTVEQQTFVGNIFFSLGQNIFLISSMLALKQKSNNNSSSNNGDNNADIESEIKALKKKIKELENKI